MFPEHFYTLNLKEFHLNKLKIKFRELLKICFGLETERIPFE